MNGRGVTLADSGELRFSFTIRMGKIETKKFLPVVLKEVGIDQLHKLEMRVANLENSNRRLAETVEQLQSSSGFTKVDFHLDTSSPFFKFVMLEGRRIKVRGGAPGDFPILLTKIPLKGRSACRIIIEEPGNLGFGLGIIATELRNKPNPHEAEAAGVLYVRTGQTYFGGALVADGNRRTVARGDHLEMRVDFTNWTVQWNWVHPLNFHIDCLQIPRKARNIEFFPYIQFDRTFTGTLEL